MIQLNNWGPAVLIIVGYAIGLYFQNKRIDDLKEVITAKFETVNARLKAIEDRLDKIEKRLDKLEEQQRLVK